VNVSDLGEEKVVENWQENWKESSLGKEEGRGQSK